MHAVKVAPALPQLHSHDRLVRVRAAGLFSIDFIHLCTVQDLSVLEDYPHSQYSACSAGVTEWQGWFGGRLVTLGWDWIRLQDGALVPATLVPPRTNLMVIDSKGYDLRGAEGEAALRQLIHGMPWQEAASQAAQAR